MAGDLLQLTEIFGDCAAHLSDPHQRLEFGLGEGRQVLRGSRNIEQTQDGEDEDNRNEG